MAPKKPTAAAATADESPAVEHPAGEAELAQAAKGRAAAFANVPAGRLQGDIDALMAERRGYVTRSMTDRVALVDEQIRLRGGTPPTDE